MERGLEGRAKGDRFMLTVPPDEAYGERDPNATQRLPKKYFRNPDKLRAGDVVTLGTNHGPRAVTVLKVGASVVDVDANHPMAGRTLTFDIEVTDVRAATPEEIEHRHAHGPGGHHH
jgi:FKBP-type peptidyl-prolyl cis-trans isomerase SlyD